MPELPSGTATFVFTDIEGSTALLKRLGDGYGELLGEHRRIVRDRFARGGGIEIDTQGDAFFFVFTRAREAVAAAVEVQRAHATAEWPAGSAVNVRIGLRTGEPALGDEGYLGLDVVRAARICTAGRGGAVLLSETTRALLGSAVPEGVSVFPLGERHLKGIDEPERVYELAIEGLPAEAAPAPEPALSKTDERYEAFGADFARRIEEHVLRSLETSLGNRAPAAEPPRKKRSSIDQLTDRVERITERVETTLREHGLE